MVNKLFVSLLATVAPVALLAEPVELRSTDGFIAVEGEIVDFNGTMLSVETSVGRVSVPASEVGCFGAGCATLLAGNSFGLTADDLQGVFAADGGSLFGDTELTLSLGRREFADLFETLASAYAVAGGATGADLLTPGVVRLEQNGSATEISVSGEATADMRISMTSLQGRAEARYPAAADWALTPQPAAQMLALDAFAVIAPNNIPVDTISVADLAGIYAGEITNWSELGGPDTKILPLLPPENAVARADLQESLMAPLGKTISPNVLTMASESAIAGSINQFPGSISVVGLGNVGDNRTLSVSGSCGVAVAPSPFNIVSGDYVLSRPVVVQFAEPTDRPLVRGVFDFAAGPVAQDVLARDGYVSQTAVLQDSVDKNGRLNGLLGAPMDAVEKAAAVQMFEELFVADRLSPTLFGGATSVAEGAWNRAMFQQLAAVLRGDAYAGREVIFVGFADGDDGSQALLDMSRAAATGMADAFADFAADALPGGAPQTRALGFGGIAPAACATGQVAGSSHARVEVWIR